MKIFVTGGSGFIAGHVIELLIKSGVDVITNVRNHFSGLPFDIWTGDDDWDKHGDVDVYTIDMRDRAGIRSLVEKSDGVIHLAGLLGTKNVAQAWDYYEVNVGGVINVLDACVDGSVPMVGIGVGNWFETNNYSNSKFAAEREILKYARYLGARANVVRGLNAYGPRQKVVGTGKIVPTFVTKALKGEPLQVYGGKSQCGVMDMIYVTDLAAVLVDVLAKTMKAGAATGQVYEAGTGHAYPVWQIAEAVVAMTGNLSRVERVPMRSGESNRSVVVAQDPYPFSYTPLEVGLAKTIEWYREQL